MMKVKYLLCVALIAMSLIAHAGNGPTSIGAVSIGMSKTDYISALGISPVNCNEHEDKRSEIKYLDPDKKTLCYGFSFRETGSSENIQVGGITYDVVEAGYSASEFIKSIGNSSKAIFYKGKLVSLEITFPEVSLETLTQKYGAPKLVDYRKTEICKNRMGNEFDNNVGNLDAVWKNGEVNAILRAATSGPSRTCTDGMTMRYYIIEEPNQLKSIENAIEKYRAGLAKEEASDSPF